ncbi:phosphatase PAP2 family protein [Candidatus Kaiserbacteria bacterium]|nr:phosphatase PAP2 family protein [Candidatus Kaiserbacteria bacterium]
MMDLVFDVDIYVLQTLYALRDLAATHLFIVVSEFGSSVTIFGLMVVVGLWLVVRKRVADAAGLAIAVCGSGATVLVLKYLVSRARPDIMYQAYTEGPFYSFPSAHATLSMALYGYLAYLLMQTEPILRRRILIILLPMLALLVAFSRLYLGVHYLSDVVGGIAIGLVFNWIGTQVRLRLLK